MPYEWARALIADAVGSTGRVSNSDKDEVADAVIAALSQGEGQPEANEWKDAVLDELAISGMDFSIGTPPREIIKALIDLHVQIATDHRVNGGLSLQPHTPHPEAQQPESRAITALKVTLFGVECYLPSSVAKAVEEACTREAQQPEAVAWMQEVYGQEDRREVRVVKDELMHWCGIPVAVTGSVKTHPSNWSVIDGELAALTPATPQGGED